MGLVTHFFIKPFKRQLVQPPAGSFLIDVTGQVFSSTLPPTFPSEHVKFIGLKILAVFTDAVKNGLGIREISVKFEKFKFQARHLPSGALIYLIPPEPEIEAPAES
jgi:hypothetical protein